MARESTITKEQVSQAADTITDQGGKATSRAIREVLGTGSMATICKFLNQWKNGQIRQTQTIDDMLDPAIARAISSQIAEKVQAATSLAIAQVADLQTENDTLISENERQTADIEVKDETVMTLQAELATIQGRIGQIEIDLGAVKDEADKERKAAEAARIELAKALLRLEAMPRLEADLTALRVDLTKELQGRVAAEQQAAVLAAKLDAAIDRATKAESRLEQAEKQAQATARDLNSANAAVQAGQARLESAAREIEDAKKAAAEARAAARKSSEEAAELRGKLGISAPESAPGKRAK